MTCTTDAFEEEGEAPVVLYDLEVLASEGGSVNTSGGSYESGSSVTVTATPEPEYLFVGWTGTESTDNPLTITVNSNQEISPIFEKKKYQLSVNVTGEGTVTEEVISTGKNTDYDSGTVVKLTAVPTDGHAFFNWTNEAALDTVNPIQITLDGNKSIDVNFDYQTARDLVGEWEFELQDEVTAKSHGRILMRIDIRLNILFTLILGNQTTQIFSRLTTLSSTTMVMGGFGAFTNVNFKTTSSSSLSFNLITFPPSTPQPTSISSIPPPTPSNSLTLSGNKTSNNTAPIVPPATATTSATAPTQTASSTNALAGVVSQVNATVNPITCTISGTLTSGPQSQTVTASTAITNVVYTLSSNCTDTLSASASGLPSGVSLSFSNNTVTISGAPSSNSSGTFDYLINAVNSTGTASNSFNGTINVLQSNTTKTYVPDNNFEQALIDLGYDNVLDDYVLTSNISSITTLSLLGKDIKDLTGINDFISLNNLDVWLNPLEKYDISGLKLLKSFKAGGQLNRNFGRLFSNGIDLSQNVNLEKLNLFKAELKNIDVSKNIKLVELNLNENYLDYIDISSLKDLQIFAVGNNNLKALDVSKNSKLDILHITKNNDLNCVTVSQNQLNSIPTNWTASNIYSLDCTSCAITGSLTSVNGSDSQIVSMSTALTSIEYTLTTTCSDTLSAAIEWTPSTPNGVSMSFNNNVATISGTPTGTATGTYNYTLTASNTAGTASATFSGSLTVSSSTSSSTTDSGTLEVNNSDDVKFVGVGINGTILTSDDGLTWSTRNSGVTENLFGVAYGLNRFIAVGNGGTILSSTDGKNWTSKNSGITTDLRKITFGNNRFVAVGGNNKVILHSNDGDNWSISQQDTSSNRGYFGVSFGNGNFVATPYNVISFSKSSDGINWSDSQANMGTLWDSEFGGYDEYFVSVGLSNLLVVSNDNGDSFSSKTYTGAPSGGNLFSVGYGDGKFVAVGRPGQIVTSDDGNSWTKRSSGYEVQSSGSTGLMAVTYGENKYVVFGNRGGNDPGVICLTSSDAITWTSELISTGDYDVYDLTHKSIPYAGSQSSTTTSCTISGTLTSAVGSDSQTVSLSTAITSIEYTLTTTCSDTLSAAIAWTPSAPNGVSMSFSNNVATISGTPTGTATGTYNYTLTASNTAGTASASFSGSLTVTSTVSNSSLIYFENGTCKCPNATVGDTATISGTVYTVVDNTTIRNRIALGINQNSTQNDAGDVNLCTTKVTDMSRLFHDDYQIFNSDISFWDTSNVTTMKEMFSQAIAFNQDLGQWDTSKVVDMSYMFMSAKKFNQNIGNWDVRNVENISYLFWGAELFNQDISSWKLDSVSEMMGVFWNAESFNMNINSWDVSNITDMRNMFTSAKSFNQDLDNWDVSNITMMHQMFYEAENFNKNIGNWDVSNVDDIANQANMDQMFYGATNFNQDLSGWCVTNISSEPTDFALNSSLTNANKPVWGTCPTVSCTISGTLTSAVGSDSQTVSMSTAITSIEYTLTTTCSDTLNAAITWTPSTPNGVSMSFSNNIATISGTPTGTATGTYNYTLTASNTAGTASATFSGSLTVSSSTASGVLGGIGVTGSTFEVTTFKSNVGTDYQMTFRDGYLYTQSSSSTIIKIDVSTGSSTILATSFVNGCSGYSGLECRLTSDGIAVDSNGHVYVHPLDVNPNPSQSIIKRIIPSTSSSTPSVTAFAGGDQGYADGNGTSAKFQWSVCMIFDSNDNLYTTDSDRIRKVTPNGDVTTFLDDSNNEGYRSIVFDSQGNMFISTYSTSRILKYVPSSGSLTVFAGVGNGYNDGNGTSEARFYKPSKMVIDSNDNLYVADSYSRIRKITPQGYVTTIAGPTSQLSNGSTERGYVDDYGNTARFDWTSSVNVSLAIDSNDNLYVGERSQNRIRKIDLN